MGLEQFRLSPVVAVELSPLVAVEDSVSGREVRLWREGGGMAVAARDEELEGKPREGEENRGGGGKTRIQFVAREGERLCEILEQVCGV